MFQRALEKFQSAMCWYIYDFDSDKLKALEIFDESLAELLRLGLFSEMALSRLLHTLGIRSFDEGMLVMEDIRQKTHDDTGPPPPVDWDMKLSDVPTLLRAVEECRLAVGDARHQLKSHIAAKYKIEDII